MNEETLQAQAVETLDSILPGLPAALREVLGETHRQAQMWGPDIDDNASPRDWAAYLMYYLGQAVDWHSQSLGEGGGTMERFHTNVVKIGALALSALAALERRKPCESLETEEPPKESTDEK